MSHLTGVLIEFTRVGVSEISKHLTRKQVWGPPIFIALIWYFINVEKKFRNRERENKNLTE